MIEPFYWHKGSDKPDFEGPVVGIWNFGTDDEFSGLCYFDQEYDKWQSLYDDTTACGFIPAPDYWIKTPEYKY